VTEQHALTHLNLDARNCIPQDFFAAALTRRRLTRYYSATPMSESGLHAYAPLLVHLIIAVVLGFTALTASGCTVPVTVSCGTLTCVP